MNQEILEIIQNEYGLLNLKLLNKVEEGVLSNNYIVESEGKKYFLKHHRHGNSEMINKIHKVEEFFSNKDFPVILSLPTKDKKLWIKVGDDYYSVLPFNSSLKVDRKNISGSQIKSIAKFLAEFNIAGNIKNNIFDLPESKPLDNLQFPEYVQEVENILELKKELSELDILAKKHIELQKKLSQKLGIKNYTLDLPNDHLIHGDFHEQNLFFNQLDEVVAVFDFEKIMMAPRAIELIRALEFICFHGNFEEVNYSNAEIFLKEYNRVYPLNPEELSKAIHFSFLRRVFSKWIVGDVYLKGNNRPSVYLQEANSNLQYLSDNLEIFENKLLSYLN